MSGIGLDGGCGGFALVVVAVTEEVWVVYCIMEAWETGGGSSCFVGSGRKKVKLIIWKWSCLCGN